MTLPRKVRQMIEGAEGNDLFELFVAEGFASGCHRGAQYLDRLTSQIPTTDHENNRTVAEPPLPTIQESDQVEKRSPSPVFWAKSQGIRDVMLRNE